jgi:Protein of unknown function (DUF3040)
MSLPARQQRVLDRIEDALKRREPRLASMFAIFNRLNIHERLPWAEALEAVPWWSPKRYRVTGRVRTSSRIRAVVLLGLAAALVVSAVFVGMSQSQGGCNTPIMLRGPLIGMSHVRNCPAVPEAKGYGHGP